MHTTGAAFLEALNEAGVSHIFANFGSDHPAILERLAEAAHQGQPMPQVVTCPNEMVGLSAAQGFAQATGRAQAVLVHVECGTQSLAGAVHNAAKHAGPHAHVSIDVEGTCDVVTFTVRDDGRGFDRTVETGGHGFTNMIDRIGALGGTLTVTSCPGAGTTVHGTLPAEHLSETAR